MNVSEISRSQVLNGLCFSDHLAENLSANVRNDLKLPHSFMPVLIAPNTPLRRVNIKVIAPVVIMGWRRKVRMPLMPWSINARGGCQVVESFCNCVRCSAMRCSIALFC